MKILKEIYNFIQKMVGKRPSKVAGKEIGKFIAKDLESYHDNVPDKFRFL